MLSLLKKSALFFLLLCCSIHGLLNIKTVSDYAILSNTITNAGFSIITGSMGAATSPTGFPPGTIKGSIYIGIPRVVTALTDGTSSYNAIKGQVCKTDLTGQDLGGKTLAPGVYCFSSTAQLNGVLTLSGSSTSEWYFQVGSALLVTANSKMILSNGSAACNVHWGIGSSATLSLNANVVGNFFAYASITFNTGVKLQGRAVALTGMVSLIGNTVTMCSPTPTPTPTTTHTPGVANFDLQSGTSSDFVKILALIMILIFF